MRIHVALLAAALTLAGCPRAEPPPQTDTAAVQLPADAQMPPVVAPGDTGQRPPGMSPGTGAPASPAPPVQRPRPTTPAPTTPQPAPSPAVSDTLRGRVAMIGAAPMMQVVLRRDGQPDVTLHGDRSMGRALRSVQGLDVQVAGERTGTNELQVSRFSVRASEGVPAVDGRLEREDDHFVLVTADGRRLHLHHLPERLRERVGQRVWLAGPLDQPPQSFGVIE